MPKRLMSREYTGHFLRSIRLSHNLSLREFAISLGISRRYLIHLEKKPFDYIPAYLDRALTDFVPAMDIFTTEEQRATWRREYYMKTYGKLAGRRAARKDETLLRARGKLKSVPELAD